MAAFTQVGVEAVVKNMGGFMRDLGKMDKGITGLGKSVLGAGATMAKVAAGGVAALGAGMTALGVSGVKAAKDFESQMAILSTAVDPATASLEDLEKAALAVGADTDLVGVSASEAADAMTGLYKAGLTTNDIFGDMQGYISGTTDLSGALRAAVDLQAASELDLAEASDAVAIAMATFGLSAEDATRISNNFVQAADASVADVSDLTEAMKNVGPTAAAFGFSLEDTNNALAILSTRGISGSEAGTALKSMLTNIQRPTKAVTAALKEMNVSLYNADGTMKSMPEILAELERGMSGMTDEQRNMTIQTIAGTYGMKALQTLLGEGTEGWDKMAEATGAASSASEVAQARTDTFEGALEALEGTIETLKIGIGKAFLPVLTDLARQFAEFINEHGPQLQSMFQAVADWLAKNIPLGIEILSGLWTEQLQPALLATWQFIQTQLIPAFQQIWSWLGENLPKAIEFVVEHWDIFKGAIIAIGAVLAGAAIAAAIAGIAAAIGSLLSPIGLIVAAAAALGAAWSSNFLGIRDILTAFWENTARPILEQLVAWLQVNIPIAIQALATFWTTVLQPALAAVWGFIQNNVIPILSVLWDWLATTIPTAVQALAAFWRNVLQPALAFVWGFIRDNVIPLLGALANIWLTVVKKEVELLAGIWQNILLPALQAAWSFIQTIVIPVLQALGSIIGDTLGPIAMWFIDNVLTGLKLGFEGIVGAIQAVIGFLNDMAARISDIQLPDWLAPGSPTPFEVGLVGIAKALTGTVAAALKTFSTTSMAVFEKVRLKVLELNAALKDIYITTMPRLVDVTQRTADLMISSFRSVLPAIQEVNSLLTETGNILKELSTLLSEMGSLLTTVGEKLTTAGDKAKEAAKSMNDGFVDAKDNIKDVLIPALDDLITKLNEVRDAANEAAAATRSVGGVDEDEDNEPRAQHGANFIVPPGYPHDTFPLRVSTGERVIVIPRQEVGAASMRQNVFNLNVSTRATAGAVIDEFEIMAALIG